jgi:hypothetical protein
LQIFSQEITITNSFTQNFQLCSTQFRISKFWGYSGEQALLSYCLKVLKDSLKTKQVSDFFLIVSITVAVDRVRVCSSMVECAYVQHMGGPEFDPQHLKEKTKKI